MPVMLTVERADDGEWRMGRLADGYSGGQADGELLEGVMSIRASYSGCRRRL